MGEFGRRCGVVLIATMLSAIGAAETALAQTGDVVLYASKAARVGNWQVASDATAAGGSRIWNPNQGAAKKTAALGNPADYFELTFTADANRDYHLWIRARAEANNWANDSVFVQFDNSLDAGGQVNYRIGSTAALEMNLEECSGCGLSEWGWEDNGWGAVNTNGPHIRFATSGTQRIRVQVREDGLSIDQIVLSPSTYLTSRPGTAKNDTVILPETGAPTQTHPEIVIYTSNIAPTTGWSRVNDATAANGAALGNPNTGQPKVTTPAASPTQFFDATFTADAGTEYHLWVRGRAEGNSFNNDSVYVQFSGTVDLATGATAIDRIGTNDAQTVIIEEGKGAGLSGWGWADNEYTDTANGLDGYGENLRFATSGPQTLRVQMREDGVTIDQIVLSAVRWETSAPGAPKNDATILNPDGTPQETTNLAPVFDTDPVKAFRVAATTPSWSTTTTPNPRGPVTVLATAQGSDPEGGAITYTWDFDGVTRTGNHVPYTFMAGGTHPVKVTLTDPAGKTASRTTDVRIVDPLPVGPGSSRIRVLTWNVSKGRSTGAGSANASDIKLQTRWMAAMQPDVIFMVEVIDKNCPTSGCSGSPSAEGYASELNTLYAGTGVTWHYDFAAHPSGATTGEGVAVLSKTPLAQRDTKKLVSSAVSYPDRVAMGLTTTINNRAVLLVAVHLTPDFDGRTEPEARRTQAEQLTTWINGHITFGPIATRVLAGDFNGSSGEAFMTHLENDTFKYTDTWEDAAGPSQGVATGYPDNTSGRTRGNRIDYVMVTDAGALVPLAAQVPDTRNYLDTRTVVNTTGNSTDNVKVRPSDHHPLVVTLEVKP